jgi:acyl-coenzyme A thioesterase PaaI-like protein
VRGAADRCIQGHGVPPWDEGEDASTFDHEETFTTLDLKINFLKPIWNARLRPEGRLVKRGRTVGLTECDILDEKGSLVGRASSTCMTLRGEAAAAG